VEVSLAGASNSRVVVLVSKIAFLEVMAFGGIASGGAFRRCVHYEDPMNEEKQLHLQYSILAYISHSYCHPVNQNPLSGF
jgi:hypothetical protein